MFSRILFATDLTEVSQGALRMAYRLAGQFKSSVTALYAIDKPHKASHWLASGVLEDELKGEGAAIEREQVRALELLREQVGQVFGKPTTPMEYLVRCGRGAETVVAVAAEKAVDLIIVGTRGRVGTIGSSAEQVVRTAAAPVLVVPARLELSGVRPLPTR